MRRRKRKEERKTKGKGKMTYRRESGTKCLSFVAVAPRFPNYTTLQFGYKLLRRVGGGDMAYP